MVLSFRLTDTVKLMKPRSSLVQGLTTYLTCLSIGVLVLAGCSSSSDSTSTAQNPVVAQDDIGNNPVEAGDNGSVLPAPLPEDPDGSDIDYTGTNAGLDIPPNRTLPPLPDPPLTPAPDADSEPVVAEPNISTPSDYTVVRDQVLIPVDTNDQLTDEDFEQGLLPPDISVPAGVDTATNLPPFFVDIDNAEVFAGEELVVLFDPDDPEGGLPGMFPSNLPEGVSFNDNFDGTKSLRWRPLEPDVGVHEVTITATDPDVPQYRSAQTIRIRVNLPSDLSTIRNLPPGINLIREHTVRVNDPVVAYIKVTDPNGTIPELQILNPPAGFTLTPHYFEEGISILHFVPDAPGTITLNLRAIDSVDASLTGEQSVNIDVLPASDFIRPGTRLRELADARDMQFGYAILQSYYERPDGAIYAEIAGEEFNIVSTENSMKFDFLNPVPGKYRWAATDNMVQQAKAHQQTIHGHTLVWYTALPSWVWRSRFEDRELIMREYIDRVMDRYADDIPLWDVVNEALEDDGTLRRSVWFQGMGASYIDTAFRQARESAPDATLIYNDYDIAFAGPKSDGMLSLVQQLKDAGTPLDGVGFQLHLFADFDKVDEVVETFQKVADLDLDIYVTELDISMGPGQTLAQQAALYEQILSACLDQSRCKAFQTWGFTDMYTWRPGLRPLILDEGYQAKPAYLSLQQRLGEN